MRNTENHNWNAPVEGDSNYEEIIDSLFEDVDKDALLITDTLPDDHIQGRWVIRTSDRSLHLDDGSQFVQIDPERVLPDKIGARRDNEELIGAEWSFDQSIDCDIDGHAITTEKADHAPEAKNTKSIAHYLPEDYCAKADQKQITGQWLFKMKLVTSTINITGDTLSLPRHG